MTTATEATLLAETIGLARASGFQGIAIIDQGGVNKSHYLAMALGRDGKVCDPRNWDTHDTVTAALKDLAGRFLHATPA